MEKTDKSETEKSLQSAQWLILWKTLDTQNSVIHGSNFGGGPASMRLGASFRGSLTVVQCRPATVGLMLSRWVRGALSQHLWLEHRARRVFRAGKGFPQLKLLKTQRKINFLSFLTFLHRPIFVVHSEYSQ